MSEHGRCAASRDVFTNRVRGVSFVTRYTHVSPTTSKQLNSARLRTHSALVVVFTVRGVGSPSNHHLHACTSGPLIRTSTQISVKPHLSPQVESRLERLATCSPYALSALMQAVTLTQGLATRPYPSPYKCSYHSPPPLHMRLICEHRVQLARSDVVQCALD